MRLLLLVTCTALLGCEEIPNPQPIPCADVDEFGEVVSAVLERRCGTLDCHGEYSRPLRLYGQNGLRLATSEELDPAVAQENDTIPGGDETTDDEKRLNWRSVCGLEPEKTALVFFGEGAAEDLMLLRKPLKLERHKGEQLFNAGDSGSVCLSCWLRGELRESELVECQDAEQGCRDVINTL